MKTEIHILEHVDQLNDLQYHKYLKGRNIISVFIVNSATKDIELPIDFPVAITVVDNLHACFTVDNALYVYFQDLALIIPVPDSITELLAGKKSSVLQLSKVSDKRFSYPLESAIFRTMLLLHSNPDHFSSKIEWSGPRISYSSMSMQADADLLAEELHFASLKKPWSPSLPKLTEIAQYFTDQDIHTLRMPRCTSRPQIRRLADDIYDHYRTLKAAFRCDDLGLVKDHTSLVDVELHFLDKVSTLLMEYLPGDGFLIKFSGELSGIEKSRASLDLSSNNVLDTLASLDKLRSIRGDITKCFEKLFSHHQDFINDSTEVFKAAIVNSYQAFAQAPGLVLMTDSIKYHEASCQYAAIFSEKNFFRRKSIPGIRDNFKKHLQFMRRHRNIRPFCYEGLLKRSGLVYRKMLNEVEDGAVTDAKTGRPAPALSQYKIDLYEVYEVLRRRFLGHFIRDECRYYAGFSKLFEARLGDTQVEVLQEFYDDPSQVVAALITADGSNALRITASKKEAYEMSAKNIVRRRPSMSPLVLAQCVNALVRHTPPKSNDTDADMSDPASEKMKSTIVNALNPTCQALKSYNALVNKVLHLKQQQAETKGSTEPKDVSWSLSIDVSLASFEKRLSYLRQLAADNDVVAAMWLGRLPLSINLDKRIASIPICRAAVQHLTVILGVEKSVFCQARRVRKLAFEKQHSPLNACDQRLFDCRFGMVAVSSHDASRFAP
jgi:hypothetical protein